MFQECHFMIGQWANTHSAFRLGRDPIVNHPTKIDLYNFHQSGQWHLVEPVNYSIGNRTFRNFTEFWNYDCYEYVMIFNRVPTFYVTVILIPAIMMGAMSILALILPVESGEKISLAVTILLAQVVELLVLSDILPPSTEEDFPIAGSFVVFLIILASISLLVTVISSTIYYTPPCKRVPRCIIMVISSRVMDIFFIAKLKLPKKVTKKIDKVAPQSNDNEKTKREAFVKEHKEPEPYPDDQEINSVGWKMFAALIDRIFLICYTTALISGAIYFYNRAQSGD